MAVMPALPKLSDISISNSVDPRTWSAYNLVLAAERAAILSHNDVKAMHARVVGFLMIAFHYFRATLGDQCFSKISVAVRSPTEDSAGKIFELSFYYRERLLRACQLHVSSPLSYHSHP